LSGDSLRSGTEDFHENVMQDKKNMATKY